MCYRQLRFTTALECGHHTLVSQIEHVDCLERVCFKSRAHPPNCGANGKAPCNCRRYFTQTQRLYTDVPGKCADCIAKQ